MTVPPSRTRTPLPPVSEHGTLPTDRQTSMINAGGPYSRPSSVQNMPMFTHSNSVAESPHPYSNTAAPFFPASSATPPPLTGSRPVSVLDRNGSSGSGSYNEANKIDMERMMKQDQAAMNDFIPPRQAMNSDESDFDWDEDINIDNSGQVHRKHGNGNNSTSKWRKLSPFLRMVILILVGSPIIALPAILVTQLMADDPPAVDPADTVTLHPAVPKATITLIFVWLSFMWGIVCVTNWGIDIVPAVVVRLSSIITSSQLEKVKSRFLIFLATKKYLKWLLASCWSIGSFAFLSKSPYSRTDEKLNPIFIEVLAAIVAGCTLVFIEKILLHMISTSFHQTAYADRMTENKYALSVLDRLSTRKKNNVKKAGGVRPPHSRMGSDYNIPTGGYQSTVPSRSNSMEINGNNNYTTTINSIINGATEKEKEAEILSDIPDDMTREATILNLTPMTTTQSTRDSTMVSSIAPPRQQHHYLHKMPRLRPNENIFKGINRRLHGIALANKLSPTKDIGSTANAKRLAKMLFYNLQTSGDELVVQDFYPYFETEEEAQRAFTIFDKDGNGDISKREMKEKIFYVYKERKDLHTSLRDLSQAVGKLDIIFLTIVAVVWLLIVLSIFGKDVVKNILSIGSFLVALSFVFGNSLKILFENIVFLFITHPYDSGDLVSIDGNDMYVREVGLNSTTFVTWDGKRMYYPNNIISQKPIHNVRRSPNMTDKLVLNVDCYTPQSKILELRARMRDYLIKESKDFLPDLEIQIQEMDEKLKISMCIEHKGNWQDSGRRWARRTAFNYALKEAVEDLGIKYYAVPQRLEIYKRDYREIEQSPSPNLDAHDGAATLGPNSPLRQYSPEHVARLYRRPTISKPEGE
ncbi:hypothetical protein BGZ99_002577 [Dissophora globulifera]|uniref:EF-hand domain-containing protein n=1 Tax=Dissophora globulifera TaxID=979702 RepID=A0A9P6RQB8_9FUNG|nr:hypothetical protein BGZ99_002577 [Dissophora globulifera]